MRGKIFVSALLMGGLSLAGASTLQANSDQKAAALAAKQAGPSAIQNSPSSGVHCTGANLIDGNQTRQTNVHNLGAIGGGRSVTLNFESDGDAVAVLVGAQLGTGAPDGVANLISAKDDDSGGALDPRISITTPFDGTWVLMVSSFSSASTLCYTYEVIITVG